MAQVASTTVEKAEFDGMPAWRLTSTSGATALVAEQGATVISWEPAAGAHVISGYANAGELRAGVGGRSAVLAPWMGHMEGDSYSFDGAEYNVGGVPEGFLGLVKDAPFTMRNADSTLTLEYSYSGSEAYPWPFDISVTFSLDSGADAAEHLSVTLAATNRSDVAVPLALGWSPYLAMPGVSSIKNLSVEIPARTKILTDANSVPLRGEAAYSGVKAPVVIDYIGTKSFATYYRGLVPNDAGVVVTSILNPSSAAQITLTQEPAEAPVVYVDSGDRLDRDARKSLCLAPISHHADSFNRYDSAPSLRLQPGNTRYMTATLTYRAH
ncbi:aldose 1-epimerase [Arcanobacterium wilhelmae]|uniref:Aldose 1-epimerase n=1 Tax=Arcanobacterium wilhelmae TaxID=1803177 RepID=A0ABT9NE87_9ACTO|nr:aldose 1-epimerase [Arcanobacterium wilhelmae]MDP9801691.1 aldose 1-epimerase [Arcanobacterium wilhelmae]WFN91011.1 aldose 1-epimerase [Arcanobacterium wilhelmae]